MQSNVSSKNHFSQEIQESCLSQLLSKSMYNGVKTVSLTKSSPLVTQNEWIVFNSSLHELCPHVHKTSDTSISNVSGEQSSHHH